MNDKNKQQIEFGLRRDSYQYIFTFMIFCFVIAVPIALYQLFVLHCADTTTLCPLPDWAYIGIGIIVVFVIISFLTGHFAKPWDPFLTISETELRYNSFPPFFLHFSIFDKYMWKSFPLPSIAAIKLFIRSQDKNKVGFKLEGNAKDMEEYFNGLSYDEFMSEVLQKGYTMDITYEAPYYKNQKLALLDSNKKTIAELTVSFAYEEDLKRLSIFLESKKIPFTIAFREMNDDLKDIYGSGS